MLIMEESLAEALRRGDSSLFVDRARNQQGFKPILVSALEHVVNGVTTVEEALKVAQQFEADLPDLDGSGGGKEDAQSASFAIEERNDLSLEAIK